MKRLIVVLAAVGMAGCALLNKPCVEPAPGPGYVCVAGTWVQTETPPPVTCPAGQHVENGVCVTDPVTPPPPVTCPAGQHVEQGVCVADPPPPPPAAPYSLNDCPRGGILAPGAYVYIVANHYPTKAADPTSDDFMGTPVDSSIRVHGDPDFCATISGVRSNDCHLEGWPKRAQCESALTGGCQTWEYRLLGSDPSDAGTQCVQQPSVFSCDHFGSPQDRDDPVTPEFEGQPSWCGLQRDGQGNPTAGPFTAPHGNGFVRARTADGKQVSGWVRVDR